MRDLEGYAMKHGMINTSAYIQAHNGQYTTDDQGCNVGWTVRICELPMQ